MSRASQLLRRPAGPVFPERAGGAAPLSRVPSGSWCVVERIEGPARQELEREGLTPGAWVVVAARTPFGGPLLVEVGRARIAVSAEVAGQVLTRPVGLWSEA